MKSLDIQHSCKVLSLLLLCAACSSAGEDDASYTGGSTGNSTGGVDGSGSSTASGGAPGNVSTGGDTSTVTGGAPSTGGADGTGGSEPITCPDTPLAPGDTTRTIQIGGNNRSYVLHVPPNYDGSSPVPLVVDFHGLTGNGSSQRASSPYPAQTDSDGAIMAFPSGLSGPSGAAWNVGPCCVSDTDDVAFARALVEDIAKDACIDPKRIYAVGFSMGGGFSHYLACHASDLFAAVAPAAFDLLQENVTTCKPERPITVVSFRGTSDGLVPYDGGNSAVVPGMPITFLGAEATFEKWADFNGCTGSPTNLTQQGCKGYSNCEGGVEVVLCTQNAGHVAGDANVAWPILKKHTLP